jgi:hypothetical protein
MQGSSYTYTLHQAIHLTPGMAGLVLRFKFALRYETMHDVSLLSSTQTRVRARVRSRHQLSGFRNTSIALILATTTEKHALFFTLWLLLLEVYV